MTSAKIRLYTAVSRRVDQNKCTYATMPKVSVGHIPYIFIKTNNWGATKIQWPLLKCRQTFRKSLRHYVIVLSTPYRALSKYLSALLRTLSYLPVPWRAFLQTAVSHLNKAYIVPNTLHTIAVHE